MIELDGYRVARLTLADSRDVQSLYERCSDYHLAHEGTPTRPTAGEEELASFPPGRSIEDKFSFGVYAPGGELLAYIELFRNYPAEPEWWLGLLMLDPRIRGRGFGTQIFRVASAWAFTNGARAIQLAVLESNPAAQRFWTRRGFEFMRRRAYESQSHKKKHTVIVMRRGFSLHDAT